MSPSVEPRPAPFFVGDHLALDFLNTLAMPSGQRLEWLVDGSDLLDWLETAGAIAPRVAARFRAQAGPTQALDAVAAKARALREWFRRFVQTHAGRQLRPEALKELAPLNRLLAQDSNYQQVDAVSGWTSDSGARAGPFGWRAERRWTSPDQLLQPIAEAIGDLVSGADFRLVRACEGTGCTLVFYDRTKAHRRRWCSMASCGNRAKAAAHRARQRRS